MNESSTRVTVTHESLLSLLGHTLRLSMLSNEAVLRDYEVHTRAINRVFANSDRIKNYATVRAVSNLNRKNNRRGMRI